MNLTEDEKLVITHALTGGQGKVCKNRFVVEPGDDSWESLNHLVELKMMRRIMPSGLDGATFKVTTYGAHAVGLSLPV